VQLPFSDPATIDILYPLQALKAIAPLMRSKIQRVGDRDINWERRLQTALLDLPLVFSPRIAEPIVTMTDLLNLRPGVVVEIPAFETLPIYVEGQPMFKGSIGERDGKMAVRILK
jgi:flagellar motor switch protein FliM